MSEAGHKSEILSSVIDGTADGLQQIAQVVKSNGSEGELVLSFRDMDPDDLKTDEPVFIFFDGLPVPFYFESFSKRGKTKAIVRITDIRTFDDARELEGKGVFSSSVCGDPDCDQEDFSMLVGWTVKDGSGNLEGVIEEYLDIPGNPCIEVAIKRAGKEKSPGMETIMIPLHEDLILSVDEQASEIIMSIPDGLLTVL